MRGSGGEKGRWVTNKTETRKNWFSHAAYLISASLISVMKDFNI